MQPKFVFDQSRVNPIGEALDAHANPVEPLELFFDFLGKYNRTKLFLFISPTFWLLPEEADRLLPVDGWNKLRKQVMEGLRVDYYRGF